jgi:hypothetical protein
MWARAMQVVKFATEQGINTGWYAFWLNPRTMQEKYDYGYWLGFYIYHDLRHLAKVSKNDEQVRNLDRAYYSGDWRLAR